MPSKANPASLFTERDFDYVIVGSGASGATAAYYLARQGKRVALLEEGKAFKTSDFRSDVFTASTQFFRNQGFQATQAAMKVPILEGCCVGGTTVMNGAILHKLPYPVIADWVSADASLEKTFEKKILENISEELFSLLGSVKPSDLQNFPIEKTISDLGWKFQRMRRSAPGCLHSGRCLQGCPTGGKWSLEKSLIPQFIEFGGVLISEFKVQKILFEKKTATGVSGQWQNRPFSVGAKHGILIAAGAIQTPILLKKSGFKNPNIGENFQCHLGVSVLAQMPRKVTELEGPTQGLEILEFQNQNFKIATQLVPPELLFSRAPIFGKALKEAEAKKDFYSSWMASIRSKAIGKVSLSLLGKPRIRYMAAREDIQNAKKAFEKMALLLFKGGAKEVFLGVNGSKKVQHRLTRLEEVSSIAGLSEDPRNYWLSAGHIFGTCRLGKVVDSQFRVIGAKNLHVIDASIFPSNIGVNPQLSIMTLARRAIDFL